MLELARELLLKLSDQFVRALPLRLNLILYHLVLFRVLFHLEVTNVLDEVTEAAVRCVNIFFSASDNAWNHKHLFDLIVNFLELFFLLDTVVLE